jgi:DNA-binding LacI/PurR family transcriptional regulator
MERLLERQVDALLVYRPPAEIDDCLRLYAEAGAPVISVFAKPRGVRLPLVTNHPTEAIRRAVDRLDRLGQRSMCHVATTARPPDRPTARPPDRPLRSLLTHPPAALVRSQG